MKIIMALLIAVVLGSNTASAVCLNGNPTIEKEYADSQSVFIGKVISEQTAPESKDYLEGTNYTVQIEETIKGKLKSPIIIFNENSSGRFPMAIGKTYIIFLHQELGRYQIDNCGSSGLVDDKEETIKTLRQIKQSRTIASTPTRNNAG